MQCSASCGEGVRERLVECVGETGKSSACDTGSKPVERESCNLGQCPQWKIGEWAEVCSHLSIYSVLCIAAIGFLFLETCHTLKKISLHIFAVLVTSSVFLSIVHVMLVALWAGF